MNIVLFFRHSILTQKRNINSPQVKPVLTARYNKYNTFLNFTESATNLLQCERDLCILSGFKTTAALPPLKPSLKHAFIVAYGGTSQQTELQGAQTTHTRIWRMF